MCSDPADKPENHMGRKKKIRKTLQKRNGKKTQEKTKRKKNGKKKKKWESRNAGKKI